MTLRDMSLLSDYFAESYPYTVQKESRCHPQKRGRDSRQKPTKLKKSLPPPRSRCHSSKNAGHSTDLGKVGSGAGNDFLGVAATFWSFVGFCRLSRPVATRFWGWQRLSCWTVTRTCAPWTTVVAQASLGGGKRHAGLAKALYYTRLHQPWASKMCAS